MTAAWRQSRQTLQQLPRYEHGMSWDSVYWCGVPWKREGFDARDWSASSLASLETDSMPSLSFKEFIASSVSRGKNS
jgi:hypothetical protein